MTDHNYYTDSREDMEALYPRRKNPTSDYGLRRGMQEIQVETGTEPITLTVDTEHPDSEGVIPVEVRMPGTTKLPSPRRRKPIVESRHGDSETDLPGQPGYHEPYVRLTPEERAQGIAGVALAKEIAANSTPEPTLLHGSIAPMPEDLRALGLSQIEKIRQDNPSLRPRQ